MATGSHFSVVPCPRLTGRDERMVVATHRMSKGDTIHEGTWLERISFVATTEEEAAAFDEEMLRGMDETRALGKFWTIMIT